ncbi:hypothetical protein C8J56DRAFT_1037253 [Mycena floridula]|nr:hypothetical protein C8J56DRAFT_1064125 [Mycena floridula]KAJ7599679.1 hypothetical protein C8J56DRAFT_1037253 [Mycena floridula]
MHTHAPEAFDAREPKKIFRVPKNPIGIHHRWAGDGHDKLYKIVFPIWGVVDDATSKYLGGWVVPSNRIGDIFFSVLLKSTAAFRPSDGFWFRDDYPLWAHKCIEGRSSMLYYNFYSETVLACGARDSDKDGPWAMSRNEAFSDLQSWGGKNHLMRIPDLSIIRELKEAMGGDELLVFTSAEFSARAQTAYDELNIQKLSMECMGHIHWHASHSVLVYMRIYICNISLLTSQR